MHIGPAWDELEKQKMLDLVSRWETQIRSFRATALETIVGDLATEPNLSRAWDACGLEQREYLQLVMRTIIDDTVD